MGFTCVNDETHEAMRHRHTQEWRERRFCVAFDIVYGHQCMHLGMQIGRLFFWLVMVFTENQQVDHHGACKNVEFSDFCSDVIFLTRVSHVTTPLPG